ncbi:MAG TPA: hypothetical protein VGJ05_02050 [Fimbriiglobus sp.]
MRRGQILGRFFDDLSRGDPVALGAAAVFVVFLLVVGVVAFRFWREEKLEQEKKKNRWAKKPPSR